MGLLEWARDPLLHNRKSIQVVLWELCEFNSGITRENMICWTGSRARLRNSLAVSNLVGTRSTRFRGKEPSGLFWASILFRLSLGSVGENPGKDRAADLPPCQPCGRIWGNTWPLPWVLFYQSLEQHPPPQIRLSNCQQIWRFSLNFHLTQIWCLE